ncbi:DUF4350 domain-containing protein [Wenzhouxiangella marina]|uniref:Uncharacterized protein n=1 Tax=Wenzhouxiangella marina TaxID=1579979 RepID=A0A0K0XVC7_9GAMM|nr:DUF4350 domain-containing protein [Wenzhouxiangella marina]AKS41571.1 hypothetical protein WM2015_1197 [Wenzhouxiangella marina]MBB6086670.1 hypothetical protein [Wenzhouxiangella marina]
MRMPSRGQWLLILGVAVVAALIGIYVATGEYREQRVYDPTNGRLRVEKLHIAQRWLERQGLTTQSLNHLQGLDGLPALNRVLILADPLGRQTRLESNQIRQWLQRGGHLIAIAPFNAMIGEPASDLNPFEIEACFDCLQGDHEGTPSDKPLPVSPVTNERRQLLPGMSDQPLQLWTQAGLRIQRTGPKLDLRKSSNGVPLIANYSYGAGRITLLADRDWLVNDRMIEADHARLLLALVDGQPEEVYLQHYSIPGGLLGWLWRQAPALWTALIMLLALWLWSKLPRLGPILADPDLRGSQIRAHLLATARFDWRHNRARRLVAALDEELAGRARYRFPDWNDLDLNARGQRLARLCPELSETAIAALLRRDPMPDADRLIELVTIQQRLIHAL